MLYNKPREHSGNFIYFNILNVHVLYLFQYFIYSDVFENFQWVGFFKRERFSSGSISYWLIKHPRNNCRIFCDGGRCLTIQFWISPIYIYIKLYALLNFIVIILINDIFVIVGKD